MKLIVIRNPSAKKQAVVEEVEVPESDVRLLEQFYKKEENVILFHMYDVLCQNSYRDLVYSEICQKFNDKYASKKRCAQESEKLNTFDVAHYCKKLEKIGFVTSATNEKTSEKKITLRKREHAGMIQSLFKPDWSVILNSGASL